MTYSQQLHASTEISDVPSPCGSYPPAGGQRQEPGGQAQRAPRRDSSAEEGETGSYTLWLCQNNF